MLADHAARVLAGGTGFRAEARRAGGHAHGQARLIDDVVAHEIGERHFGGGDEPAPVDRPLRSQLRAIARDSIESARSSMRVEARDRLELILGEFRQLRRAEHGVVAHEKRRVDLGIAVLARVQVEHE